MVARALRAWTGMGGMLKLRREMAGVKGMLHCSGEKRTHRWCSCGVALSGRVGLEASSIEESRVELSK